MADGKQPFVLLSNELLRGLLGALEFAAALRLAHKSGELRWTLASLVAASAHAKDGDIVAVCGNRRAASLLRTLGGSVQAQPASANVGHLGGNHSVRSNVIAGMALAQQQLVRGGVVLAFCGDAGSLTGGAEDALRASAAQRLPILWITQTELSRSAPVPVDGLRPRLPRIATDAEDAVAIYRVLEETLRQARTGGGPTWLDLQTGVPDTTPQGVRQPRRGRGAELSIEKMRAYLQARGLLQKNPPRSVPARQSAAAVVELS